MTIAEKAIDLLRTVTRKTAKISFASLAAFAVVATPASAQRGSQPVSIDTGGASAVSKSIVLPLDKAAIVELPRAAADVLVSQPGVVDAVVRSPRRVFLLGLEVGQTNAFFFDGRGRQILNLEIRVERDMDALAELLGRVMPNSRIEIDAVNDNVILRGTVQTASEAANAQSLAARFVDDEEKVVNMLAIRDPSQVMLKVRIVEMQRTLLKQLGVQTSGSVVLSDAVFNFAAANSVASSGGLALDGTKFDTGDLERLDASFQAFETTGLIRILAEPNLTAVSGESARFLAGGEFPVPVGQEDGVISIEFKEFGVGLGFTPVVIAKGRINMQISTEVSEVTSDNAFFVPG
ncbi:MAG: BON domain-containing protein, partial [Marinicaulis sp.]|nr:BON domain-containing protein [Marinicaulis sp.]